MHTTYRDKKWIELYLGPGQKSTGTPKMLKEVRTPCNLTAVDVPWIQAMVKLIKCIF